MESGYKSAAKSAYISQSPQSESELGIKRGKCECDCEIEEECRRMVPKRPFWAFATFIWPLLLLLTLVDCCQIEDLEYNSLTSTSVVLTWEVLCQSEMCPVN